MVNDYSLRPSDSSFMSLHITNTAKILVSISLYATMRKCAKEGSTTNVE